VQVSVLTALALAVPAAQRAGFTVLATTAAAELHDAGARGRLFGLLTPAITALPPEQLQPLWTEVMHRIALRTRSDLLADLAALAPVAAALAGADVVSNACAAISDVSKWWP